MHTAIYLAIAAVIFLAGLLLGLFYGQAALASMKSALAVIETDLRADPRLQMFADRVKALISKKKT